MAKLKTKIAVFGLIAAVILIAVVFLAWPEAPQAANRGSQAAGVNAAKSPKSSFNKNQYSINDASSLWVVVNKGRVLPSDYVPAGLVAPSVPLRLSAASSEMHLRADAAAALEKMFAAASAEGVHLQLESGYRSYAEQVSVYGNYIQTSGQQQADTYSARPGHSEHQTGLAADIEPLSRNCEVEQCFENTPEGLWLAANSYKFGFIIRYPKNAQDITGYEYEPWHVRYIGTGLAAQIHTSGQTLEQFFGLPIYTTYPAQSYEIRDL